VADPLIGQGPTVVRRLASLYSPVIRRSRAAWGAVYHTSNTRAAFAAIRAVFGPGDISHRLLIVVIAGLENVRIALLVSRRIGAEEDTRYQELRRRWRGDAVRVRERAGVSVEKLAKDLGLVTRRELDELELRIAQLEHRLNLLERDG